MDEYIDRVCEEELGKDWDKEYEKEIRFCEMLDKKEVKLAMDKLKEGGE